MNETDFIRQQLAVERTHLREILLAVRRQAAPANLARPVSAYIEWAGRRLVSELNAHCAALQAVPTLVAAPRAQLREVAAAAAHAGGPATGRAPDEHAQRLLVLLDAWRDCLDALAAATLRIGHWRQAAHLSADTILEERQLYAAARVALAAT
jgi:hypothetical protein